MCIRLWAAVLECKQRPNTFLWNSELEKREIITENISWNQLFSIGNCCFHEISVKKCEWGIKHDLDIDVYWKIDSFSVKSTFLLKKLLSRNFDQHRNLWYFFIISTMWLLSLTFFFCSYLESSIQNFSLFTLVCKLQVDCVGIFSWFEVGINENML